MAASGRNEQTSLLRNELALVTESELAKHLRGCRRHLDSWRVRGLIPYFKVGRAVRFRVTDVAEELEKLSVAQKLEGGHPRPSAGPNRPHRLEKSGKTKTDLSLPKSARSPQSQA